jgi:hypothetical protein
MVIQKECADLPVTWPSPNCLIVRWETARLGMPGSPPSQYESCSAMVGSVPPACQVWPYPLLLSRTRGRVESTDESSGCKRVPASNGLNNGFGCDQGRSGGVGVSKWPGEYRGWVAGVESDGEGDEGARRTRAGDGPY